MRTEPVPQPPRRRSSILEDFAAARGAAPVASGPQGNNAELPAGAPPSASGFLLGLAIVVGTVVFVVGLAAWNVVGAVGGFLGLAVAVAALILSFGRAGTLGRLALATVTGVLMLVVGLVLGIQVYDEKYFGDQDDRPFWDAVTPVYTLLMLAGTLLVPASVVALAVVAIVRLVRRD
jgi:hypothetical protein